jgi:callose synthase
MEECTSISILATDDEDVKDGVDCTMTFYVCLLSKLNAQCFIWTCLLNMLREREYIMLVGVVGSFTGRLNCDKCRLELRNLVNSIGIVTEFINTSRPDQGPYIFFAGAACLVLVLALELFGRMFSSVGVGFVGHSLHVPSSAYCRYLVFWLFLFLCKISFDYQFMVKNLVETTIFIWFSSDDDYLQVSQFMIQFSYHNILYIMFLWIPAIIVFLYDAQIFYALLSVVFGSIRGFNLRIGELRSFRILRLTFKSIPKVFNKKMVSNLVEARDGKKKKKKEENQMPQRRFERISYSEGSKPLTVTSKGFSSLLENDFNHGYSELKDQPQSHRLAKEKQNSGFAMRHSQMNMTGIIYL